MSSEGLPVVLFGKLPLVTTPQTETLLPEIDVIHLIESLSTAKIELPLLLSPASSTTSQSSLEPITPASQKGSNTHRPPSHQRRPKAVIVGGKFSPEEFEELRKLEGAENVPWLRADNSLVPESEWPPNPVYPIRAAGRIKDMLRREGILGCEGVGEGKGEKGKRNGDGIGGKDKEVKGRGEVWYY